MSFIGMRRLCFSRSREEEDDDEGWGARRDLVFHAAIT
jgi:hypothetical protein